MLTPTPKNTIFLVARLGKADPYPKKAQKKPKTKTQNKLQDLRVGSTFSLDFLFFLGRGQLFPIL